MLWICALPAVHNGRFCSQTTPLRTRRTAVSGGACRIHFRHVIWRRLLLAVACAGFLCRGNLCFFRAFLRSLCSCALAGMLGVFVRLLKRAGKRLGVGWCTIRRVWRADCFITLLCTAFLRRLFCLFRLRHFRLLLYTASKRERQRHYCARKERHEHCQKNGYVVKRMEQQMHAALMPLSIIETTKYGDKHQQKYRAN